MLCKNLYYVKVKLLTSSMLVTGGAVRIVVGFSAPSALFMHYLLCLSLYQILCVHCVREEPITMYVELFCGLFSHTTNSAAALLWSAGYRPVEPVSVVLFLNVVVGKLPPTINCILSLT